MSKCLLSVFARHKAPLTLLSDCHPSNHSLETLLQHPGYPTRVDACHFGNHLSFGDVNNWQASTVALSSDIIMLPVIKLTLMLAAFQHHSFPSYSKTISGLH